MAAKQKTTSKRTRNGKPTRPRFWQASRLNILAALSFVLMFGAGGVFLLSASHAATAGSTITSGIASKCLDNYQDSNKNGNKVDIWSCNGSAAQKWTLTNSMIESSSGKCLDNWGATKKDRAPIKIYTCSTKDPAEKWVAYNGEFKNPASGKCLDDPANAITNGTELILYTCNGGKNQKWTVSTPPTTTPTPPPTSGGGTGSSASSSTFKVVGNTIENASGQAVMIHGVDRPSMEWSCNGASVTNGPGPIPASDFTTMRNTWNANAVRVPLNQDFWLSNAAKHCSSYQSNVATVVKNAEAAGLIVILDLHWSDQGNLANANPGQQCMADQNSVTFWKQIAAVYKSDPNVWFELYNEPHDISWSVWQNGGSACGFQATGMQALYNAVRGAGANNIVVAGGTAWASSLNGLPKLSGTNIAYAIHLYRQNSSYSTAGWDSQFGGVENQAPVISTEFGDQVCDGQGFDQSLLSYFRSHKVGYTAWAWFVQKCQWPSLITNAAGTCNTAAAGCAIENDMRSYN